MVELGDVVTDLFPQFDDDRSEEAATRRQLWKTLDGGLLAEDSAKEASTRTTGT
jgi:hypothetical protein